MWPELDPSAEPAPTYHTRGGNAAFHNFHNDYSHIQDPNQRRRLTLAEVDKIPFGWYHMRAVSVAGIGFFTDSYDLFAMNLALQMVGMAYWQGGGSGGVVPGNVQTAIKAAISGGAVLGQVGFGVLADWLGRRRMYGVELSVIVGATLAQSLCAPSEALTMTGLLIFWRVIMGIGIGGDYPMSAVITSEYAPTRWRGAMMASVFSMQGAGQLAAILVALVVTYCFRNSFAIASFSDCDLHCQIAADRGWRIIIGISAFPAIFALYYRLTIPETPRYTFDVAQDVEKADADIHAFKDGKPKGHLDAVHQQRMKQINAEILTQPRASWSDFCAYFGTWQHGSALFATTFSWFLVDLVFYGLGLNYNIMLAATGYGNTQTDTVYHNLFNTAIGHLIIVCAGSLPGYWLSVLLIDTTGRRPLQISSFALLTLLFAVIGFAYESLSQGALLVLFILVQLFFNFGSNTTTFIVPGECFPTRYRSTAHGISAAGGKIGATVAQVMALALVNKDAPVPQTLTQQQPAGSATCTGKECEPWVAHLMQIFAAFMLLGALVSFLIPETKRRTLEELAGEKPFVVSYGGSGRTGAPGYQTSSTAGGRGGKWSGIAGSSVFSSPVISSLKSPPLSPVLAAGKREREDKATLKKWALARGRPQEVFVDEDEEAAAEKARRQQRRFRIEKVESRRSSELSLQYVGTAESARSSDSKHSRSGGAHRDGVNGEESAPWEEDDIPLHDLGGLVGRGGGGRGGS